MAFDVLYRDGEDLTGRPLRERRPMLEAVIASSATVLPARRLAADGLEVACACRSAGKGAQVNGTNT